MSHNITLFSEGSSIRDLCLIRDVYTVGFFNTDKYTLFQVNIIHS